MKRLWKALIGLAVILALTVVSCPGEGEVDKNEIPIDSLTVTYGGVTITSSTVLDINVDEEITLTANAESKQTPLIIWRSLDVSIATVTQTGVIKGVGTATATREVTIECTATNDSGGSRTLSFKVNVYPKLTGVNVFYGITNTDELDELLTANFDEKFSIQVTPAAARGDFDWTSDNTSIQILADGTNPSTQKIIKGTANATGNITVKPTHGGLTSAEITALTKTFEVKFDDGTAPPNPVTVLDIKKDNVVINYTTGLTGRRGWTIDLTADLDVLHSTTQIDWTSSSNVIEIEEGLGGLTVVLTATEANAGGEATITVSAGNKFNSENKVEKTFKVTVPARGNVIFEWDAADYPNEENFAGLSIRRYPGFRDVAIGTATGSAAATHYLSYSAAGMRLGNQSGVTPANGNLAYMIGVRTNEAGTEPIITGATAGGNTNVGTLDLSSAVKLTIDYKQNNSTGNFRIYVNNNNTGAGDSNLGTLSQFAHFGSVAALQDVSKLNADSTYTYSCIIDYNDGNRTITVNSPGTYGGVEINLSEAQKTEVARSFIALRVANNAGNIDISRIRLEKVAAAGINIGREADFTGFPAASFTLNDAKPTEVITLTGTGYVGADWYINGVKVSTSPSMSYTVNKATLTAGNHSLTAIVTVNGQLYSRKVMFTVE